jgi:putative heme-binding domain-containing protein
MFAKRLLAYFPALYWARCVAFCVAQLCCCSLLVAYQATEWSSTALEKTSSALPPSLRSVVNESIHLRAYVKVPAGWTDASGPNVITQSISMLVPETFPNSQWWINGQSIGAPIRVKGAESTDATDSQKVNYRRLAVPYGVLKKDQVVQIDALIDEGSLRSFPQIAAPTIASYHEEINLAGVWLLKTSTAFEPTKAELPPANFQPFDKVMPGTAPLAAPTEMQPTRHLSPGESLAAMQVTDGLIVDQVLAEPDVGQPVGMTFDGAGRLWIAEYRQYPYPAGMKIVSRDKFYRAVYDIFPAPPPQGPRGNDRISVHEDADGDGRFEKHLAFVEGLNLASSMLPTSAGVWVLNPPYLLLYADADGDLRADGPPEVHLTGFGMEDTHSVANSLRLGPDGWIYGAMGSTVSSSIVVAGRNDPPLQCEGAAIWRYHPATKRYEIFAEGGGNAFCVTFDAEGRLYSGHNGNDTRGFHYWQGAYYRKDEFKHGVVSNPFAYGFLGYMQHPPTPRFSHALVRYCDDQLPARFQQQLLAVDPLKGTVVLSKMTPRGGTFATEDLENSLAGEDPAFRPVDIQVGPDGNVYVADFCEEFIAHGQHYLGMLNPNTGRVYRLRNADKNIATRHLEVKQLPTRAWPELCSTLASPSLNIRAIARELILDRAKTLRAPIVADLKARLRTTHPYEALESLWLLHRLNALDSQDWEAALTHSQAAVRMWGVRLIGDWNDTATAYADAMIQLAERESNPEVLCQLACSAKRLAPAQGIRLIEILVNKTSMSADPNYGLLLWWGIEPHLMTARGALMTWLSKPNRWQGTWLVDTVSERIVRKLLGTQSRRDALDVATMYRAALEHSLASVAGLQRGFDQGIANRVSLDLPDELVKAVLESGGGSLSLRLRLNDTEAKQAAIAMLRDTKADAIEKRSLIQTFGLIREPSIAPELLQLLGTDAPAELQLEALYTLEIVAKPEVLVGLLEQYTKVPPVVQEALLRIMARRESTALVLLEHVEQEKLPESAISTEIRDVLGSHIGELVQEKLGKLLPLTQPLDDEATRTELLRWGNVLQASGGNPYQGKNLFVEHCGKCHKLFNEGGEIGPELTRYNRDDRQTLLLNILRPSQEVREGYRTFQVLTSDGRIITGFVVDDNDEILTLREASGQSITLPKEEIEEFRATPKSVMPEGILDKLTDEQVKDLFAYLQSGQPLGR